MMGDFRLVIIWWGSLFLIGAVAYPLTRLLFSAWFDRGYLFSKAVGLVMISYLVWLGASLHILPFTTPAIFVVAALVGIAGLIMTINKDWRIENKENTLKISIFSINFSHLLIVIIEEIFFLAALCFWAWIKAHEPSIHGLEKFMDFGFAKSILNSRYFPPADIWFAGDTINYYYFGHFVMALLTRLSGIDLRYTFNLMLATIFAFTFTMSFSIGYQLLKQRFQKDKEDQGGDKIGIIGGLLTAFLVASAGNMQTIYAFTQGYTGENVKPFWELFWPITKFWQNLPVGLNTYWYANATRFIPYTIHEFPSYSFVVSDVHGHVLSLPFVLLAIAMLFSLFKREQKGMINKLDKEDMLRYGFYGLLLSVLYMTNVLDAPIYGGLIIIFIILSSDQIGSWWERMKFKIIRIFIVTGIAGLAALPFFLNFKAFVSGLAVNCPPVNLANSRFGPIIFESVEKCQHSPIWMMWILWGFFIFCGVSFIISKIRIKKIGDAVVQPKYTRTEVLLVVFFVYSIALIIFPEFFYFKDIYPMHFRSNTMFKLGYQAFIMFSIISGYAIVTIINRMKADGNKLKGDFKQKFFALKRLPSVIFLILLTPQLLLVSIYPIFAVRSYFDSLRTYHGLDGMAWFKEQYPDDYAGIEWLDKTVSERQKQIKASNTLAHDAQKLDALMPVIVEAEGDSYTDYARISAFTGLQTIIGWPVHEWLWRGTYDIVGPRRDEVRKIYESQNLGEIKAILTKYQVSYLVVGSLEKSKYTAMNLDFFPRIGSPVFQQGQTVIYKINSLQ
jgi:uncharacterized membrane protein